MLQRIGRGAVGVFLLGLAATVVVGCFSEYVAPDTSGLTLSSVSVSVPEDGHISQEDALAITNAVIGQLLAGGTTFHPEGAQMEVSVWMEGTVSPTTTTVIFTASATDEGYEVLAVTVRKHGDLLLPTKGADAIGRKVAELVATQVGEGR